MNANEKIILSVLYIKNPKNVIGIYRSDRLYSYSFSLFVITAHINNSPMSMNRYATSCWLYRYRHPPTLQIQECNQCPVFPYLSVLSAILHPHTV